MWCQQWCHGVLAYTCRTRWEVKPLEVSKKQDFQGVLSYSNIQFDYLSLPLTPLSSQLCRWITQVYWQRTFDTQPPRKNSSKSCCTICLKITSSCGLRPLKAALWLVTVSWVWIPFVTFVKCHHRSVSPIFCVTFNFIPSIIGSHKNNLYYQC